MLGNSSLGSLFVVRHAKLPPPSPPQRVQQFYPPHALWPCRIKGGGARWIISFISLPPLRAYLCAVPHASAKQHTLFRIKL
jgi:hypothetical protein